MLPRNIAARLYCAGGLTLASLAVLSLSAVCYVKWTELVVVRVKEHAIDRAGLAADIEILLERHRRIVESAPAQPDRDVIDHNRDLSEIIAGSIQTKVQNAPDPFLQPVGAHLQDLVAHARRIFDLTASLAKDESAGAVKDYVKAADRMQDLLQLHREHSLEVAERHVTGLVARGQSLTKWFTAAAILILICVGPLALIIISDVVRRIKSITESMRRIALNDTALAVPSTHDHDEIGEMARALEVFKRNAITLLGNTQEIEKLNGWFDIALNNMARGLSMFDAERRLIVCNRRYRELYGIPDELALPGTELTRIAQHWLRDAADTEAEPQVTLDNWLSRLERNLENGQPFLETHRFKGGRTVMVNFQPLDDGGWVDVHEDITEKRLAEARINELARFDTLTSLANRHHFLEELDTSLAHANSGGTFALLWIDLDKFKAVNDTLGHPIGDALLEVVSKRLRECARGTDLVARLGGDEFAVLQRGDAIGESQARALATRLLGALATPFLISGHSISIGASIGIALAPEHGTEADDLLKNADIALYRAKTAGRGTCVFYSNEFEQTIKARRQIEVDLRRAVAAGELMLYYQPIIDLARRHVTGCEALMRWRHPVKGMIPPSEFIPLAEEIGLIGVMGEWALDQACRDASGWPAHIKVAVNLSASQFAATDLVAVTRSALVNSGLSPQRLELEVTESLLLKDNAGTLQTLSQLRDIGVAIALDDFGTGYASLSYLRSFPIDKIKIDQSFVRDLPRRGDCVAIVRAVVDLAKTLGMRTVAEGVETIEHLDQVTAAGCDEVQGYHFSRPVPAHEVVAILEGCGRRLQAAA